MNSVLPQIVSSFSELNFHWQLLIPTMIVLGGGVVGLLLEAFVARDKRWSVQCVWSPLVLLLGFLAQATLLLGFSLNRGQLVASGELIIDGFAMMSATVILLIGLVAILPIVERTSLRLSAFAGQPSDTPGSFQEEQTERKGYQRSEMLPLTLFSVGGMMLFPMANSLLTLFVVLEVISLPLYLMTAMARYRRLLSQEAALKYFILGAFASAFLLMGVALLYGYSGSLKLTEIALLIPYHPSSSLLLYVGVAMVLVGLLFKVGAAPFHAWTPDVYQGAPTPVTGFMAAGVKAAAFLTLLRFYAVIGAQIHDRLQVFLWVIALLTMAIGTFFGLVQSNVKRMLAYSSIAHAGFLLICLVPKSSAISAAMLFYLLAYGLATVGAFAIIYLVRKADAEGTPLAEYHDLSGWAGLGKTNPVLAVSMMLFLLSFAGIPLTAGFMGKFLVFGAGIEGGATPLVVAAVVASAITAFFYFRLGKIMFLDEPTEDRAIAPNATVALLAVEFCALLTVILGVFPGPVLDILKQVVIVVL